MRGSRFKEEQIIAILREQEAGVSTAEVCRKLGKLPPADFARLSDPATQQGGTLRSPGASRPAPLHYRA